ncbi:MAG: hypothetical protein HY913_23915 [Desulfomonile tiedjei]|nr:hypothetical protein [Desulfomonile tiedjei]
MAQELGDSNQDLAKSANRFFDWWATLLTNLFDEAKALGKVPEGSDGDALSRLVICTIEGALLVCKASKDTESFKRTAEALKLLACRQPAS